MSTQEAISLAGVIVNGIALIGLFLLWWQIRNMTKANTLAAESNKLQMAMAVVALEQAIADARARFADISHKINHSGVASEADKLLFEERLENYLNFMDRLCSYIRRGFIDEEMYRQDYRQVITETVASYSDKFTASTRHRNIRHVNDKWHEDKSARG